MDNGLQRKPLTFNQWDFESVSKKTTTVDVGFSIFQPQLCQFLTKLRHDNLPPTLMPRTSKAPVILYQFILKLSPIIAVSHTQSYRLSSRWDIYEMSNWNDTISFKGRTVSQKWDIFTSVVSSAWVWVISMVHAVIKRGHSLMAAIISDSVHRTHASNHGNHEHLRRWP